MTKTHGFIIKIICGFFYQICVNFLLKFIAFSRLKLVTLLLGLFVKFFYQIRGNFLLKFVIKICGFVIKIIYDIFYQIRGNFLLSFVIF